MRIPKGSCLFWVSADLKRVIFCGHRRVLVGLNKGETLHSLARALSLGHQGRFTERSYEAQLNRTSALSLVINAIVVWNTRYFERAQAKLLEQGEQVADSVWQHLSPLAWKHISFIDSYHFSDIHLEGDFRPLRESERRHGRGERAKQTREESTQDGNELPSQESEQQFIQLPLLQDVPPDAGSELWRESKQSRR
jgi:hypothetical protein